MRDHSAMSENPPDKGRIAVQAGSPCRCIRESMLLTCVLYSVVHAAEALAGDQSPRAAAASMFPAAFTSMKPLSDVEAFSATEFRPRPHSLVAVDPSRGGRSVLDAPMLKGSSLWQQMGEYRSQDRLRLLTLWQTRGSSLSLQAGKRGAPSLQWSTPWVHREGASRGLFDHLLTAPARFAGSAPRSNAAHPATAALSPKPADLGPPK
jgi:hypothetical protein